MVWPIQVARNAPTMPSTVVRMNPLGLLGPGESNRAIMPAIKPTMMILIMSVFLPQKARMKIRRSVPRSEPARHFVVRWQPSVRRQMVDDLGQMLAQAVQQILTRQAALRHHMIDLI